MNPKLCPSELICHNFFNAPWILLNWYLRDKLTLGPLTLSNSGIFCQNNQFYPLGSSINFFSFSFFYFPSYWLVRVARARKPLLAAGEAALTHGLCGPTGFGRVAFAGQMKDKKKLQKNYWKMFTSAPLALVPHRMVGIHLSYFRFKLAKCTELVLIWKMFRTKIDPIERSVIEFVPMQYVYDFFCTFHHKCVRGISVEFLCTFIGLIYYHLQTSILRNDALDRWLYAISSY